MSTRSPKSGTSEHMGSLGQFSVPRDCWRVSQHPGRLGALLGCLRTFCDCRLLPGGAPSRPGCLETRQQSLGALKWSGLPLCSDVPLFWDLGLIEKRHGYIVSALGAFVHLFICWAYPFRRILRTAAPRGGKRRTNTPSKVQLLITTLHVCPHA